MHSKRNHTVNKKKRQPNACEKIFASGVFDKGLLSKIYKELIQLNNPPSLIKIWTKDLNRHFFQRRQMTCRQMKWCSVSFTMNSVQLLSRVWLFSTPWIAAHQASLSITNSRSLLKLMSIKLVMPSSHLILYRAHLLLPPIPPSIRVFSNESTLPMRWPKYWSFSFSISPSSEHPGLIPFTMDWLDLLAVQGTLKSLLQHHSSKASILQHSAFFTFKLSHQYIHHQATINQNHSDIQSHTYQMTIIRKITNKYWWWFRERGTLVHCWWECKFVQ